MFHVVNKELRGLIGAGETTSPTLSFLTADWNEKDISCSSYEGARSHFFMRSILARPLWRGPALLGIAVGTPLVARLLARLTVPMLLEGLSILALLILGAYWLVVDTKQRGKAWLQERLEGLVLDDVLRAWMGSTPQQQCGHFLFQAFGAVVAGLVAYGPLATVEDRLRLLESALSLSRDEAQHLLRRPGGVWLYWKKLRFPAAEQGEHLGSSTAKNATKMEPLESQLGSQKPTPRSLLLHFETCEDAGTFQSDGNATLPPIIPEITNGTFESCAVMVEDVVTKLTSTPDDDSSSASTAMETPEAHRDQQPLHASRRWEADAGLDEERHMLSTSASTASVPDRRNPTSSELTSSKDSVPSILRSIVSSYVMKHYLRPNMPEECHVERVLCASLGVCALQLLCSRRSRQMVSGVLQALTMVGSLSAATSCLAFLLLAQGDERSPSPSPHPISLPTSTHWLEKLDIRCHAFACWLIHNLQHLPDAADRCKAAARLCSEPQHWSNLFNPQHPAAPTLKLLSVIAGGTHESLMGVARPVGRLLDRTKVVIALVALALARWKHKRRLLVPQSHEIHGRNASR